MSRNNLHLEQTLTTLGGRITCRRCQAQSKRTKLQCAAPAISGKRVCKNHGGRSNGPLTDQGRQRCAEARTKTGTETRQARIERAAEMRRLRALEDLGHALGLMKGAKTPGRKPLRSSNRKATEDFVLEKVNVYLRDYKVDVYVQ